MTIPNCCGAGSWRIATRPPPSLRIIACKARCGRWTAWLQFLQWRKTLMPYCEMREGPGKQALTTTRSTACVRVKRRLPPENDRRYRGQAARPRPRSKGTSLSARASANGSQCRGKPRVGEVDETQLNPLITTIQIVSRRYRAPGKGEGCRSIACGYLPAA